MLALAGSSHAFAADSLLRNQQQAPSNEQHVTQTSQTQARADFDGRSDWNVDYPSQLGPQSLPSSQVADATMRNHAGSSTPASEEAFDVLAHPEP
jgi:hypothetical protein